MKNTMINMRSVCYVLCGLVLSAGSLQGAAAASVEHKSAAAGGEWQMPVYRMPEGPVVPKDQFQVVISNKTPEPLSYFARINAMNVQRRRYVAAQTIAPSAMITIPMMPAGRSSELITIYFDKESRVQDGSALHLYDHGLAIEFNALYGMAIDPRLKREKAANRIALFVEISEGAPSFITQPSMHIDIIENKTGKGPALLAIPVYSPAQKEEIAAAARQGKMATGNPLSATVAEYLCGEGLVAPEELPRAPGGPAAGAGAGPGGR